MKKILVILFTVLVIIIVIKVFKSKPSPTRNKNLWKSDLVFLRDSLPKLHKNLYFKISKSEYENKINSLILKLGSLPDDYILLSVQDILSSVGDSHTVLSNWVKNLHNKKVLPVKFGWFSDGIYIIETKEQFLSVLGVRILSIGNIPIDSIVNKFQKLIVNDNDAIIKLKMPDLLRYAVLYNYYNLHSKGDTISITTQDNKGKIESFEVVFSCEKISFVPIKLKKTPLYSCKSDKIFWNTNITKDSILYIQYNQCTGKEVYSFYKNHAITKMKFPQKQFYYLYFSYKALSSPSFNDFSKNIYAELNTKLYRKIIFDIRYNAGGSSEQGTQLIDSISKFKNVKIYGIVGRATFSSGLINAIDLKNKNAIMLGENTSGMAKHYGEVKLISLPKTKFDLQYSTKYFDLSDKYTNTIYPDFNCEVSFEDYISGIDPCMEFIKQNRNPSGYK